MMRRAARTLRLALVSASVSAAVILSIVLGASASAAQGATVDGGSWEFDEGSTGNMVSITLSGLPAAGLGAADITVAFDPAVLSITACTTGDLSGACNPNAPAGPARAAGFAAPAITTEPVVIATLTVDCVGPAGSTSELTITVNELMDGTPGDPQPIAHTVQAGTVRCGEAPAEVTPAASPTPTPSPLPTAPPETGGAPGDTSGVPGWLLALLVGLSIVALALGGLWARGLRRRA